MVKVLKFLFGGFNIMKLGFFVFLLNIKKVA